jgi:hypothetical protein
MLRLYQLPVWVNDHPVWEDGSTTFDMEIFATPLFLWAQTRCSRVDVVAWGLNEQYDLALKVLLVR